MMTNHPHAALIMEREKLAQEFRELALFTDTKQRAQAYHEAAKALVAPVPPPDTDWHWGNRRKGERRAAPQPEPLLTPDKQSNMIRQGVADVLAALGPAVTYDELEAKLTDAALLTIQQAMNRAVGRLNICYAGRNAILTEVFSGERGENDE